MPAIILVHGVWFSDKNGASTEDARGAGMQTAAAAIGAATRASGTNVRRRYWSPGIFPSFFPALKPAASKPLGRLLFDANQGAPRVARNEGGVNPARFLPG